MRNPFLINSIIGFLGTASRAQVKAELCLCTQLGGADLAVTRLDDHPVTEKRHTGRQ